MPSLVEPVPYDANWLNDFSAAEALLRTTLGKCVLAVDHIGSTAVPGLAAKPMLNHTIQSYSRSMSGLRQIAFCSRLQAKSLPPPQHSPRRCWATLPAIRIGSATQLTRRKA
ncbi:GrpB family protein [Sinorhizobium meliloti]